MARVAVLIDRAPTDPEWKGAAAWSMINALAESQHDVQVFTPLDPATLHGVHPRVGVARPAAGLTLATMVTWGRALVQYRPDVIHTFAPHPARFSKLTIWPYLDGLSPVLPRTRRVATLFDADDVALNHAARGWLATHARWSVFHRDLLLGTEYRGELDVLGIDDLIPSASVGANGDASLAHEALIPAPVDEWVDVARALDELGAYLRADPDRRVRIIGGWGRVPLSERRRSWSALGELAARVHLSDALDLSGFVREVSEGRRVWTEPLRADSWRARVAAVVRDGPRRSGDTINQLSRIYSAPGGW